MTASECSNTTIHVPTYDVARLESSSCSTTRWQCSVQRSSAISSFLQSTDFFGCPVFVVLPTFSGDTWRGRSRQSTEHKAGITGTALYLLSAANITSA